MGSLLSKLATGVIFSASLGLQTIMFSSGFDQQKRPLDLPSGGPGRETEEDAPESINFYEHEYEGDAFFWCGDKSSSMGAGYAEKPPGGLTKFEIMQQQINEGIRQLSGRAEFSIVLFNHGYDVWSHHPKKATRTNKMAAQQWVQDQVPDGGTVMAPPGVKMLQIGQLSSKRRKVHFIIGDRVPADPEASLEDITFHNYESKPIHTLYVAPPGVGGPGGAISPGLAFMQQLAALNQGTCRQVYD